MTYDDFIKEITAALSEDDAEKAEELLEEYIEEGEKDECDILEEAFCLALNHNCFAFVENHIEDLTADISDYISETEDPDLLDLLFSCGASRNWEEYPAFCKFAFETINQSVITFDPKFQKEVYRSFLKKAKITEEEIIKTLEDGVDYVIEGEELWYEDDEEPIYEDYSLQNFSKGIGFFVKEGKIVFHEFDYLEEDCSATLEILEALGYELLEEGTNNAFPRPCGPEVYFIKK